MNLFFGLSRSSDGNSLLVLLSSTQPLILDRNHFSLSLHMPTLGLNKQCGLFTGIIEKKKKGGKREPGMPVSACTFTGQPLPQLVCQMSEQMHVYLPSEH